MEGYTPEDRELLREMRRVRRVKKGKRLLIGLLIWGFLAAAAGWIILNRYCALVVANGPGMGPAVPAGSVVLAFQPQAGKGLKMGDVILFGREDAWEIKRVAAVGGDEVDQDENGQLTVNGTVVDGCSASGAADMIELPFTVPEGEYFVLGDRYALSVDSRSAAFGTVELPSVAGVA
ncbi:MAG: signal peptidase I [Clostridia bacterium]|nr:signal peptidase I [Clostridia bacterium]